MKTVSFGLPFFVCIADLGREITIKYRHAGLAPASMLTVHHNKILWWLLSVEAMKKPAVYILASKTNGTLYIGVTSDLIRRVWQHRNDLVEGFTRTYEVHRLVWYECCEDMMTAIGREQALKNWKRNWKIQLIEKTNPEWIDLYSGLL